MYRPLQASLSRREATYSRCAASQRCPSPRFNRQKSVLPPRDQTRSPIRYVVAALAMLGAAQIAAAQSTSDPRVSRVCRRCAKAPAAQCAARSELQLISGAGECRNRSGALNFAPDQ